MFLFGLESSEQNPFVQILQELGHSVHLIRDKNELQAISETQLHPKLILWNLDRLDFLGLTNDAKQSLTEHCPILFFSDAPEPSLLQAIESIPHYGLVSPTSPLAFLETQMQSSVKRFKDFSETRETLGTFRTTIATIPDLLVEADRDGNFIRFFGTRSDLLAAPEKDLLGKSIFQSLPPEVAEMAYRALAEADEKGFSLGHAYKLNVPKGELWFELSVAKNESIPNETRFIAVIRDITERKQNEERISKLLNEKEQILAEVHHRIKNNLSMLYSMLTLQSSYLKNKEGIEALDDSARRIQGMSLLYQNLFQSQDFGYLEANEYLSELLDQASRSIPNGFLIHFQKDLENFKVDAKTLQLLGLVMNEIISHMIKVILRENEEPNIEISMRLHADDIHIAISDKAKSSTFPLVDTEEPEDFGLVLVTELTKQLRGEIRSKFCKGTQITLRFPLQQQTKELLVATP